MTFADFITLLDSAPRPNGKPVGAADARKHLRDMEEAFHALCESPEWTETPDSDEGKEAQRIACQGAIDAMGDARSLHCLAVRAEREAARRPARYVEEDVADPARGGAAYTVAKLSGFAL